MKALLLTLILVSFGARAGFEKLIVENLDLDYTAPHGSGMVDRVGIGMSLGPVSYPIEITKTENSFELTSPYVDFTWKQPLKFIHELEALKATKTYASLGTKKHFVQSETFMFQTKAKNTYKAKKVDAFCEGNAEGAFDVRLMEDCRKNMELTIREVDIPADFILLRLMEGLPFDQEKEADIPADHIVLKIKEGDYFMQAYVKYWVYAGLRIWGHMQYENDHQTVAIRVDQVKFGYLPITKLFLQRLKEVVKSPEVKIDPPWIRIKTKRLYENR